MDRSRLFENLLEEQAMESEEAADAGELEELFPMPGNEPLDLNTVSSRELSELGLLNEFQVAMLLDYRKNRSILSVYELLYVPGFRQQDIQNLLPLVNCIPFEKQKARQENFFKSAKHQLLLRYQRILESASGYLELSDSIQAANPEKSHYLGSPDKIYLRYLLEAGDQLAVSVVMEKDAGETLVSSRGFDFYSGSLRYSPSGSFFRHILVGDFQVRAGQGLLMWTSFSMGKSAGISGLSRRPSGIEGNRSASENRHLRGASVCIGAKNLSLTLFGSSRRLDATPADTLNGLITLTGFQTSGLHNTPTSLKQKGLIREDMAGALLAYDGNRLHLGLNGMWQRYDGLVLPGSKLYQNFLFNGTGNSGISADFRYLAGRIQLFGEWSRAYRGWAALNGMLFFLKSGISVGILHRFYQRDYFSALASAFGENSRVNNEEGLYLTADFQPGRGHWVFYADIFSFPWLRYGVDVPSLGAEWGIRWERQFDALKLFMNYRYKNVLESCSGMAIQGSYGQHEKHSGAIRVNWDPVDRFSLQWRSNFVLDLSAEDSLNAGCFFSQDMVLAGSEKKCRLRTRIAWFWAEGYPARLYVYEPDLLYTGGVQMYYGRGWRFSLILDYKWNSALKLGIKLSQSLYPGETEIGSGLNRISENHKTEVKLQVLASF
ncbi:MAG: hypothetical protein JW801_12545 [Bacteroidales bacterium]|nr:hypothetical protein [Bacteroidales bacterium]